MIMKKIFIKICGLIIVLLLAFGSMPAAAFAESAKLQNSAIKIDTVTFRKEYFMQSSYIEDIHLAKLSAQTMYVAESYFDSIKDPWQTDPSTNAYDLISLLEDKGFQDVEANKYYSVEELENSIAVAAGHMTVEQEGKQYTLLAVIPRSTMYKQEWAGNFYIGENGMHNGFKAARDEVLRFIKKYVNEHNIKGDVKLWTAGHSRGAAVANMVGGFFAGGGVEYLGNKITIAPTDIYSYCFATPCMIKNGISKADELSVDGPRGGRYSLDTAVEAFRSRKTGKVDTAGAVYRCIKNYEHDEDIINRVPDKTWGYTYYGVTDTVDKGCTWDEMMTELFLMSPHIYEDYKDTDPAGFKYYTVDLSKLAIVPDEKKTGGTLSSFLDDRIEAVNVLIPSNKAYVESGYQEAMIGAGGINGMLLLSKVEHYSGQTDIDVLQFVKPGILTFLAYAAERIKAEELEKGIEISDSEALGICLAQICKYISGLRIPAEPDVDYMIHAMAEFIAQNRDSDFLNQLLEQLINEFGFELDSQVKQILQVFTPTAEWDTVTDVEMIKNVLVACSRGPEKGTLARIALKDGAAVRAQLYSNAGAVLSQYPDLLAAVDSGNGSLANVSAALLDILVGNDRGESKIALDQAADAGLAEAIEDLLYPLVEAAQEMYGYQYPAYQSDALAHIEAIKKNITCMRRAISYLLFYTAGQEFNIESLISSASTVISNASMIPPAHTCECYVCWICARAKKTPDTTGEKKAQSIKITAKKGSVKSSALKRKNKILSLISVKNAKGKVTYKKKSGSSRLTIDRSTGKIKVKKRTKKGTYSIRVIVNASGTSTYKAASRTATVTVKVR